MKLRSLAAALVFTSCTVFPAQAQWVQTTGPTGGPITVFSVRPSNGHVFAIAGQSVYRSSDGGATWTPKLHNGIAADAPLNAVGAGSTTIFVAGNSPTVTTAIFRSTDNGDTWVPAAGTGLPIATVINTFYFAPTKILAGISNGTGVYASTNSGDNWTPSNTGFPVGFLVRWIVPFGSDLYAGGGTAVVYRSVDGGATWTATTTIGTPGASLVGLTSNASGVFAATSTQGIYKTTDNGVTWPKVSPAGANFASAIEATATNVFAGVNGQMWKADAAGAGWAAINTGLPSPPTAGSYIGALAVPTGAVLAGMAKWGVYRSTDASTWAPANTGMLAHKINGLHISNGFVFAAADGRGFFRSADHGTTWTEIGSGIVGYAGWYCFARTAAGTLLGGNASGQLNRSTNNGDTWTLSNTGLGLTNEFAIISDGATIYAGGYHDVSKSVDDGMNWTPLAAGFTVSQTVLDLWKKGSIMLAGANAGIKRSIDSGASWTAPIAGIPSPTASYGAFTQVGTELFLGSAFGVYRSLDDGANWAPRTTGIDGGVAALYANGEDLYAGTNKGVYHSIDRGGSWTAINDGFPINFPIYKLTGDGSFLIAGGTRNSVWRRPLVPTGVSGGAIRGGIEMSQNTPNPLNAGTEIAFSIPRAARVRVEVFDITGARVARLVDAERDAGRHTVSWDGRTLRGERAHPGVYIYELAVAGDRLARKMIVTR